MVNALPLALLVITLLYLDQYQNGLLEGEVAALREQARIYAGALGESAVRRVGASDYALDPGLVQPLLRRLTEATPSAEAQIYAPDGQIVANSRENPGPGGRITTTPRPPARDRGRLVSAIGSAYDWLLAVLPHRAQTAVMHVDGVGAPAAQPDVKEVISLSSSSNSHEMPPYIWRTRDNRLLLRVAEPVEHQGHTVGIILLTREAREVDNSLLAVRISILELFGVALALTVLLSWYLSFTIAGPILRLAGAARAMREGTGRTEFVPRSIGARRDEIGSLARALTGSASALWARMDATEQFAADVAHEIKNPLSSIRSAIETLRRIDSPAQRQRLLAIIADDVLRLDRLISDISDSSRIDAELSRAATEPVDVAGILGTLAELHDATRAGNAPVLTVDAPASGLRVRGVEDRLVQVLRNLIGNAISFSPPAGMIRLNASQTGSLVEIAIEDQGPGVPEDRLEHIFDRFYTERPEGEQFGRHSGLGLSISRQIVEALAGRISAENRRDAMGRVLGARFVVRLPAA